MQRDFLGSGWAFPVQQDQVGRVALNREDDNIQDSIWIILATAPGERIMRPDFGCGVHRLVFALDDSATRASIASEVRLAVIRWEPRVDVLSVDVTSGVPEDALLIRLHYRVRRTNNFFNLVYPFYLSRGLR
ncbi:MAG TPA: GPW/gp25 family protein [Bryobacteraceae bacterium]|nr:GPW/gp25 family protein [Bryobacteraceae bacterium]